MTQESLFVLGIFQPCSLRFFPKMVTVGMVSPIGVFEKD